MNITQAIDKRKSRRTYLPTPIRPENIALLKSRIEEYNQRSGLTMRFMENGAFAFSGLRKSYGMFKGVQSLFIMKGLKGASNLKEKIGYYGELLVLEASALGLGTCWVGAFPEQPVKKLLGVPYHIRIVAITPLGVPDEAPAQRPRKPLNQLAYAESWGNLMK